MRKISGLLLVTAVYVPLSYLYGLRPAFVSLVLFDIHTSRSRTSALGSPMTSLDKLAKMDGWDVGEGDTGTYERHDSLRTSQPGKPIHSDNIVFVSIVKPGSLLQHTRFHLQVIFRSIQEGIFDYVDGKWQAACA